MGYLGSALGATAGIIIPVADFMLLNGVCRPRNQATLDKFKALQTQLNRVAEVKKLSKIAIDGDIGPGTLALAQVVKPVVAPSVLASVTSLATSAETVTPLAKQIADNAGAPAKVASPKPATTPSYIAPTGAIVTQPVSASAMDAFNRLGTTGMLVAAAVLGGGAYLLIGKKRRGR